MLFGNQAKLLPIVMKHHRWIVRGLSPSILRLVVPLWIHHDLDQVVHILSKVLLITDA